MNGPLGFEISFKIELFLKKIILKFIFTKSIFRSPRLTLQVLNTQLDRVMKSMSVFLFKKAI